MTLTADDIRAIVREEIRVPKARRDDGRIAVTLQVSKSENQIIRDEAAKRGLCIADLLRLGLETVLGHEFRRNRQIPIHLQTGQRARQEDVLREKVRQGLIARRMLRDTGAAVSQTSDASSLKPVPRLAKPVRPE